MSDILVQVAQKREEKEGRWVCCSDKFVQKPGVLCVCTEEFGVCEMGGACRFQFSLRKVHLKEVLLLGLQCLKGGVLWLEVGWASTVSIGNHA